ncbi:MAG: 4-diphosphocytidyl-2C-methyl-D-erythritol kinase, partial [Betaproteobacteria bacterium AqS2]|nr:4-diphosphocytidyl-2C-methyl-D-erythritol kinase [Betaproteobacteria bacterium AqS2]
MKTAAARGCVLAHALRLPEGRIAKGSRLTAADLRACAAAGIEELTVLRLAAGDLGEDAAAARAAKAAAGPQLRTAKAVAGRVNAFAKRAGLFRVDEKALRRLNAIDPALTIATLPDRQHVAKGQMVATVKAIRFAARAASVARWERGASAMHVAPYRRLRAGLIQTTLPTTRQSLLAKGVALTESRLRDCEALLAEQQTCAHDDAELAAALAQARRSRLDLLLVLGASSVCDPHDVVPAAIRACGGEVIQVGMPVDPGNLLVLGRLGRAYVIGMPSCARSPKENGFDWVLRRICAGE